MKMTLTPSTLPFSRIFSKVWDNFWELHEAIFNVGIPYLQLEQDIETIVKVLQPGPLGIIEHKFTAEEIERAASTVRRAVENWRRTASIERNSPVLKDFIDTQAFSFRNPR
ncbi:UNVERIFIED_CONTAM: hypothetical protein Slati_0589700 [Sesamum latifolium]|uniref:Uncharacterized protein n=1 Tax=Sesamum latifolium TaxID=2727402 RepID=A0AAW2Y1L5_9LAMI